MLWCKKQQWVPQQLWMDVPGHCFYFSALMSSSMYYHVSPAELKKNPTLHWISRISSDTVKYWKEKWAPSFRVGNTAKHTGDQLLIAGSHVTTGHGPLFRYFTSHGVLYTPPDSRPVRNPQSQPTCRSYRIRWPGDSEVHWNLRLSPL